MPLLSQCDKHFGVTAFRRWPSLERLGVVIFRSVCQPACVSGSYHIPRRLPLRGSRFGTDEAFGPSHARGLLHLALFQWGDSHNVPCAAVASCRATGVSRGVLFRTCWRYCIPSLAELGERSGGVEILRSVDQPACLYQCLTTIFFVHYVPSPLSDSWTVQPSGSLVENVGGCRDEHWVMAARQSSSVRLSDRHLFDL